MRTIKLSGLYDYDDYDERDEVEDDGEIHSPVEYIVELYGESKTIEIPILVDFTFEPDERDGSYVSYLSDVVIDRVVLNDDISIEGELFPKGTPVERIAEYFDYDINASIKEKLEKDVLHR